MEQGLRDFFAPRGIDLDAQAVVFQLCRTWAAAQASIESRALRPLGITHAGFVLLMTLWVSGPSETRALAARHHTTKAAIVNAINTLQRAGLVSRCRSSQDKRLVTIALTDAGRDLIERAQAAQHCVEQFLTAGLDTEERKMLARLLRRVGEAARQGLREETP